ncbi:snRNA-activating protein complex subunit 1 [Uranotaenia lowii]|uniref:snRNA-activating protein complex subunit 1 n=1 Tax=Uranotaenia lowii TaxID=190385 RepID=UPI002479C699|nr:snRNA-activating protein complex subunit 1 [Uranotaenia lowii]
MASELSRGFREDCYGLIHDFARNDSLDFRYFCQEWKKANFHLVFYGRNTDTELIEFINEGLLISKYIFLKAKKPLEKVGAFYLLYTLYFKQPTNMFCKIRVTLNQWQEMKDFVQQPVPERECHQIAAIFWKMFIAEAFRFVVDDREHGYDPFFIKGLQSSRYDERVCESFKIIKEAEKDFKAMKSNTGLFTALDALEMGYNEMKESLDEPDVTMGDQVTSSDPPADKIPQSNLMETLHKDLDTLIAILNTNDKQQQQPQQSATSEEEGRDADRSEVQSSDNIGDKRSSIRDKAFRRKVQRRDLQIATASTSSGSSSQVSSSNTGNYTKPRGLKFRRVNTSQVLVNSDLYANLESSDEDEHQPNAS